MTQKLLLFLGSLRCRALFIHRRIYKFPSNYQGAKRRQLLSLLLLQVYCIHAHPVDAQNTEKRHPLYIGVTGGYGSTTWSGLVPAPSDDEYDPLKISLPVHASEGGALWGFEAGYEFSSFFAVEANYMQYPPAKVGFAVPESSFPDFHNGATEFTSKTDTISVAAKLMVPIPRTKGIRFYSSVGGAGIRRNDIIINYWHFSPSFGFGFTYDMSEHWMAEFGGNYIAGYGESAVHPEDYYFPFLYTAFFKLAYRF